MRTRSGDFSKHGIWPTEDGMMFNFSVSGEGECAILLYHLSDDSLYERVVIDKKYSIGDMYSVVLLGKNWHKYGYLYEFEGKTFVDPYAHILHGRDKWADAKRQEKGFEVLATFERKDYEWQNSSPNLAASDILIYKLHMRGYTMQHGLPVSKRGNYKGILEKIDEIKQLGVTAVEFQPIYDFEEIRYEKKQMISPKGEIEEVILPLNKINYWGYGDAFYMAPKASFFGGKEATYHCKEMIDAFHGAGIEAYMEVSFATEISDDYMMDTLWHWVSQYHIDGFHILGINAPMQRIADHKGLASTKIFYETIPQDILMEEKNRKHLFLYNDYFMHVARQIQNHMEGSMLQFTNHLKRQNDHFGFVNYIANTDGFTLLDSYSFGEKHNEANGEDNKDGNNINYSYNYGAEGPTKNRGTSQMRLQQIRNGLCCVFLAQAIPLLRGGDEWLNSQDGNNNPYCQDNAIGWTNYGKSNKNKERLLEFTKNLIEFRKKHPVLSMENAVKMNDYRHVGIPDISYHGAEPWLMGIGEEQKAVGILYAGAYGDRTWKQESVNEANMIEDSLKEIYENVYIAYNFHCEGVRLALPSVPGKRKWKYIMNTNDEESFSFEGKELEDQRYVEVSGSSISIFVN